MCSVICVTFLRTFGLICHAFSVSDEMILVFVSHSVYVVDYIYWLTYVEPTLHLWVGASLIMVDDFFYVFLDLICKYFSEKICTYIQREINNFLSLGIQGNCWLIKELSNVSSVSILQNLKNIGIFKKKSGRILCSIHLVFSPPPPPFLVRRLLITVSVSLGVISLINLTISDLE